MQEHEKLNERLTKKGQDQNQQIIKTTLGETKNSRAINVTPKIEISDGQISLHNPTKYNNSSYTIPVLINTIIEFG
jgi:hypothetical protein